LVGISSRVPGAKAPAIEGQTRTQKDYKAVASSDELPVLHDCRLI